jgi:hypothetical protein
MLMIPALVRDRRAGGPQKMNQTMALYFSLYCAGCLSYLAVLWSLRGHIFQVFYGGRYTEYMGWPLLLAGALPLGTCAYSVLGNGLRALERPDRMFWAFAGSSAAAALVGIPLTAKYGVTGALLGNHASSVTFVLALWWLYRSMTAERRRAPVGQVACPAGFSLSYPFRNGLAYGEVCGPHRFGTAFHASLDIPTRVLSCSPGCMRYGPSAGSLVWLPFSSSRRIAEDLSQSADRRRLRPRAGNTYMRAVPR